MRPLRLVMNAFGPYRGKIDLDFTKFGTSSIFLVNGPTGAGKTMIFDALTYALYNETSGKSRDADMLKSQFATDEDLCYVELTFELGGATYRVYRVPQQKGPGQRTKTKKWTSEVEFYRDDELLETGRNATVAIQTLMGLTVEQFRQIVMLPQGEFRRLLVSGSNEKEEIFRNIFGTGHIQAFQERLKDKRRDLRNSFKEFEAKREQILSSIVVEEDAVLADAIERKDSEKVIDCLSQTIEVMDKELVQTRAAKETLDQQAKKDEIALGLLKEKDILIVNKTKLEEQKIQIQQVELRLLLHEQATIVKIALDKKVELQQVKEKTTKELATSKVAFETVQTEKEALLEKEQLVEAEKQQLGTIRKEIQTLEVEQQKFAEVTVKEKEIDQQDQQLKTIIEDTIKLESLLEGTQKDIQILEADIENIQTWRTDLKEMTEQINSLTKDLTDVNEEKGILEKLAKLKGELAGLLKENKTVTERANASEHLYDTARQQYFGNLAGILAMELEEEEPCPVCGSVHHPAKASSQEGTVTDEELTQLEKQRAKDKQFEQLIAERVNTKANAIKEQQDLLGYEVQDIEERLTEVKESSLQLEQRVNESLATKDALEKQLERETTWREALAKAQQSYQETLLQSTQANNQKELLVTKIKEGRNQVEAIKANLHFASAKAVQAEIDTKNEQIATIEKHATAIQRQLTDAKTKQASLEATIHMLEKQLTEQTTQLEAQSVVFEELLAKYDFTEEFAVHLLEVATKEQFINELKQYEEEKAFNTRRLAEVETQLATNKDTRSLAEIETNLFETHKTITETNETIEALITQVSQYKTSLQGMQANFKASEKIAKPLAIYEELAEIADGRKLAGYVSFERYVLSIYFEEVLHAANQRFENMTNNQYEMIRREDRTKGGGAEGLDIDVFDRYTGKTRSVNTLSGGETFKASLALALGLSEIIQSQQGGVHVDTLFVDEGFGTLDVDSLEVAIETLIDLQTTGRLIGIISHVEELKERIPARIVVEKQQEGSHAHIEVE